MNDMPALVRVKGTDNSTAPVILQPYESAVWGTVHRLRNCDIYALPNNERCWADGWLYSPAWWMQLFDRDVTLWPVDIWSSHIFTTFIQHAWRDWTERERLGVKVLRWAWGSPAADELGEPAAVVETLWRRGPEQMARAAE